jgi:phosphoadenosine phosphosulfate reductase
MWSAPMPLDARSPAAELAAGLNAELEGKAPQAILARALRDPALGRLTLVSSFGAESVVLLHLASGIDRAVPVLFIDTEMLFPETIAYQAALAETLGLTDLRVIRPSVESIAERDPTGDLHRRDADACCTLRKVEPLSRALKPFDSWITGRKRFQSGQRAALAVVEAEDHRLKVNPLAGWSAAEVSGYMDRHDLPRHPLVARGYASIGCAPCTSPVRPWEDPRSGRWRGQDKDECGIHFIDGRLVRGPAFQEARP